VLVVGVVVDDGALVAGVTLDPKGLSRRPSAIDRAPQRMARVMPT
jgi:hypothetical protein